MLHQQDSAGLVTFDTEVREFIPSLGKSPRNITIDPTGEYLFAANQSSDNVVIFKLDAKTGHLTPTGQQLHTGQPGSVFFIKASH